jgi:flagellar hook-associated protein 2
MAISASGVGSGIDINSIVSQLMAVERKPLDRLQTDQSALQSSISAFGKVASGISTFQDSVRALSTPEKWQVYQATSTSDATISASAASTATEGTYSLTVTQLAASAQLASGAYASDSSIVGTGTLHLSLGSIDAGTGAFTIQPGKSIVDINVGDGSLTSIRNAINAADAGVTATIVNTGSGSKLVVSSKDTGAQNAIRITTTDADGIDTDSTGLSALAFDPALTSGAGKNLGSLRAAQNALFTVNGIPVSSASNQASTTVDGITFNLKAITATPVSITVAKDTAAIQKSVNTLISSYNDLQKLLKDQTKYVEGAKTQSPLQGDNAAQSVLQRLRSTMFGQFSGQTGDFSRLSDVGVSIQTDGTLALDQTKWTAANADPAKLARLFSSAGTTGVANTTGFAKRLDSLASDWLGTGGTITSRTDGLAKSVTTNQKNQDALQARLTQREARLRAQYQAMDSKVAGLQSLGTYVSQQLTALQNSMKNN